MAKHSEFAPVETNANEWKVYFKGGFWGHHARERAGKKILLDKQFGWDDEVWYIPAIYTCSKGLVVDFCIQVSSERIRLFMKKWNLPAENFGINLTDEQQMRLDAENPLFINVRQKVMLNGKDLPCYMCWGVSWNPLYPESTSPEANSVVQHYGLEPAYGWVIKRASYAWARIRKPHIKTLSIKLMQEPIAIPGTHFRVSSLGDCIEFTHPATGAQHGLTVREYELREMPQEYVTSQNQEAPSYYTTLVYTLSPDMPDNAFAVTDCVRSDLPRRKSASPAGSHENSMIASVGIIGGAYGPTAIMVGGSGQDKLHAGCSALHFKPTDDVEWRTVFYEKSREDITIALI